MRAPVCFALSAALALPVHAQLRDPTEPPAAVRRAAESAAAGTAGVVQDEEPAGPQLQSVLISAKRRVAVIDGQPLRLGQKYRGAVLESIMPTQVVLVRGGTREILKLYPAAPGGPGQGQR